MRFIVSLAAIGFLALCWQAYQQAGWGGFDVVLEQPWGFVTLMDVALGAVCMSAVIFHYEKHVWTAALWSLLIFPLGHVVSAAWLVFRFSNLNGVK
jgi:hypothetical protein